MTRRRPVCGDVPRAARARRRVWAAGLAVAAALTTLAAPRVSEAQLPSDPNALWAGLDVNEAAFNELVDLARQVHLTGVVPPVAWVRAAGGAVRALRPKRRLTARALRRDPRFRPLLQGRVDPVPCLNGALTLVRLDKQRRPDSTRALRAWRLARRALNTAEQAAFARVSFGPKGFRCVMSALQARLPEQTGLPAEATATVTLRRQAWRLAANHLLKAMDPHAMIIPNRLLERLDKESGGVGRVGVGLEVAVRRGAAKVVRVVEQGPAWRAGLRPGDTLLKVAGRPVTGWPAGRIDRALAGPVGSELRLVVARRGRERPVTVVRAAVRRSTVTGRRQGPRDEVLVVRLPVFASGAGKDLRVLLRQLKGASRRSARAVVLDMRGNTGGWVQEATAIADTFLRSGEIVRVKMRGEPDEVHRARRSRGDSRLPLIVLVDGKCRSSCELVSDALQAHGRAVVVGATTYGKGTVQGVYEAERGPWSLLVTIARYHGPDGGSVQVRGVTPDLELAGVARGGFRESSYRGALATVHGDPKRRAGPSSARSARLKGCLARVRRGEGGAPPAWLAALAQRDAPLADTLRLAVHCRATFK